MQFQYKSLKTAFSHLGKPVNISPGDFDCSLPERVNSLVAGGDAVRVPVDKQAAMVTAPAPWWAILSKEAEMAKTKEIERMTKLSKPAPVSVNPDNNTPGRISGEGVFATKRNIDMCYELVGKGADMGEQKVKDAESLLSRAKEVNAAIEHMANHFPKAWFDMVDAMKEYQEDIRTKRAAIEIANKQMMSGLRDVRKFLFDDRHEDEIRRLEEFVSLCERLQALKVSGFLDTIADTLINLNLKD